MQQKLNLFRRLIFLSIYFLSCSITNAQNIWQDVSGSSIVSSNERYILPSNYKTYALDFETLVDYLVNAPKEFSVDISSGGLPLSLPMPDGQMHQFLLLNQA